MATIGSLAVNIVARTDKFVKGITKSRSSLSSFSKTTQKATGMVKGFVGAFAAGVGIVGITRALTDAADRMDKLAKTSDKLGIASERLAGLQHAAAQTGVSTETLNMALQRMVRRVAEAANGTGEAVKALQELNLDAKELNSLAPDKIFSRVADEMAKVENQGDKVRLAMKLFDSEGVSLVNTLNLSADGLEKMQKEAEKLGIAFSRDELARVEQFNDAMDRLGKAFKGAAGKIVIDIAPAAVSAIDAMMEATEGIKLLIRDREKQKGKPGFFSRMMSGPGTMFGREDPWLMAMAKAGPNSVGPAKPGFADQQMLQSRMRAEMSRNNFGSMDKQKEEKANKTREEQLEVLRKMERKMGKGGNTVPVYSMGFAS